MKEKNQLLIKSFIIIIAIILCNSISSSTEGIWHYIFYNGVYCLGISVCVPIFFWKREENKELSQLGIKKLRMIDYLIIITFVIFSVGGQLINVKLENLNWGVLPLSILPLIVTTFSEEFLFRGFLQIRLAKAFGAIPAIISSGILFSLYHLGYPGFRNIHWMILLSLVGMMFALSKYNLAVAYFVNLPNAYFSYLLNYKYFPPMNFSKQASVVSVIIIFLIGYIFYRVLRKNKAVNGELNDLGK